MERDEWRLLSLVKEKGIARAIASIKSGNTS